MKEKKFPWCGWEHVTTLHTIFAKKHIQHIQKNIYQIPCDQNTKFQYGTVINHIHNADISKHKIIFSSTESELFPGKIDTTVFSLKI